MTKLHWNDSVRWNDTLRDSRKMDPNLMCYLTYFQCHREMRWPLGNPSWPLPSQSISAARPWPLSPTSIQTAPPSGFWPNCCPASTSTRKFVRRAGLMGAGQPPTHRQESSVSTLTGTPTASKPWTPSIGMVTHQLVFFCNPAMHLYLSKLLKALEFKRNNYSASKMGEGAFIQMS